MTRDTRTRLEIDERSEALTHLAELLNLAGEYFLEGPACRFEKLLGDEDWIADLRRAGFVADSPGGRHYDEQGHKRVFSELLRVPGATFIPPFEEAYRDSDSSSGAPAHAVCQQVYELVGYDKGPFESYQSDHVGHQLRFLGATAEREAECMRRGDSEAAGRVATWRRGFVHDRCEWWQEFANRIDDSTDCSQIRTMAALVRILPKHLEHG